MTYCTKVIQETGNKTFCVIYKISIFDLSSNLPGSTLVFGKVSKVGNNTVTEIWSIQEKGTAIKVYWYGNHPHTRYPTHDPIGIPKPPC